MYLLFQNQLATRESNAKQVNLRRLKKENSKKS